jgi:hypothetical protein
MNVLIEVAAIEPPKPGGKVHNVITSTGAKLEIFPEKVSEIAVGGRYNVELKEREYKGRILRTITKVAGPARTAPQEQRPIAAAPPPPASAGDDERAFVSSMLGAFIRAGKVHLDENELAAAIATLRQAWRQGFGEGRAQRTA